MVIVARNLLLCFSFGMLAGPAIAGSVAVTNANDSGAGSLRQAILDANSGACAVPCTIEYGSTGNLTVAPLTPLPAITAYQVSLSPSLPALAWTLEISGANVTGGSGLHVSGGAATITGVIVNGFPGSGIVLDQCAGCRLFYDILGLDSTGTHAVPNNQNGVTIIGGIGITINENTIGGNGGNGVYAAGTDGIVSGLNVIGKQYLPQGGGDLVFPNGASGVFLQDVHNASFDGDLIANNGLDGIATAGSTSAVIIETGSLPTAIYGNGLMPVDIGFDGVSDAGRPRLTTAEISNGFMRVIGSASAPGLISVFAGDRINQYGIADAKTPLYQANVGAGPFEFRFPLPSDLTGQWISAMATTDTSSELSVPLQAVTNNQDYPVTTTSDSGRGSLRQAIIDASNGICSEDFPCRISFVFPGPAHVTIVPRAPLPPITRSGITIDGGKIIEVDATITISSANGDLAGDSIQDLMIANADGPGILIDASANSILDPTIIGSTIVSNRGDGVLVRGNVPFVHNGTFGSGNRMVKNTITGNGGDGVKLEGGFFELDSNTIESNDIGVEIQSGAQAHLESNTIAFNRGVGLSIASTDPAAFKASIANPIYANGGDAIRQQPTVQAAPVLTSATYDPTTGVATVQGTVVPAGIQGWTTAIDLYAAQDPEAGGRGSGEKLLLSSYSVEPVGPTFTFTTGVDVRGMRVSATATPFIYEGFKTAPDIFGQGFRYGTTSEMSRAIPVVTTGCPADVPQILSGGALPFRWSTVTGASAYNVWLRPVPGTPQMIGTTSGDTFAPSLGAGTYEWFVEALDPGCPSMKSDAARVTITGARHRVAGF